MSGDRFARKEPGVLPRIPRTKKKALTINALSPAMPKDAWQGLRRAERPVSVVRTDVPQRNLLKQLGKRKWRPTKDQCGPTLFVERLNDSCSISLTSENVPVALSVPSWREQPNLQPRMTFDAVACCPERHEDGSLDQVEWSNKRLCRHPATSRNQQTRALNDDVSLPVSHCSRQPTGVMYITEDVALPEKFYETTEWTQRHVLVDAKPDRAMDPSPAHESGPDHPLSKLKWPFEGGFCDVETKRGGGGGGGSQPSTTGSQGFPQFITAGPSVSLFGHDLFGYGRESAIEYTSWA